MQISLKKERVCNHKWKDFNWFTTTTYDIKKMGFIGKVIKPYVCIHCYARKDVILQEEYIPCTHDDYYRLSIEWINNLIPLSEQIRPRMEVENEINDFILVDREYLELYNTLKDNYKITNGLIKEKF